MSMKMAGVALAAAMSVCALVGGVERAEALTVDVSGIGVDPQDGTFDFNISVSGRSASLSYRYSNSVSGIYGPFTVLYQNVSGTGTATYSVQYPYYASFNVYLPQANVEQGVYGSEDPSNDGSAFFTRPSYTQFTIDLSPGGYGPLSGLSLDGSYFTVTSASVGADLSSVPLPASAPLLGAALLILGGAGYARRRSSFNASVR